MSKDNKAGLVRGMVVERLPGDLYRVELMDAPGLGKVIMAHLSGKMKFNHINVLVGDEVDVRLDPYGGKTTNRIERRI